jgi:hypothetical protein
MENIRLKDINYLREIVSHMDFKVIDLGEGRVRISSESQRFDFEFDSIALAVDFVTDIN